MRADPERISLDLIARKLAECSDEELASLVGAERLLRTLSATVDTADVCHGHGCAMWTPMHICPEDAECACHCCPEHRCGA